MSNALLTVTFSDGYKLYGQYQGSSDVWYKNLFETAAEAWSYNRHDPKDWIALTEERPAPNPEPCEIWSDFGFSCGPGLADRTTRRITSLCYFPEDYE